LRAGSIPVIGAFAHHHWFVTEVDDHGDRWEVWQSRNRCADSWGYLHKNLMPPDRWIGRQRQWVVAAWEGEEAQILIERIETSPDNYPWCDKYHFWPGPNSNTYAQWVLGANFRLGPRAWGAGYPAIRVPWANSGRRAG